MRVAMLSVHTCPLAALGGKDTGGMNVYVRELSRELGNQGVMVDIYTRSQDHGVPRVCHDLGPPVEVIHIPAGPEQPYDKRKVYEHLPEFVGGVLDHVAQQGLKYDLIHSHYWLSGVAAMGLREAWGGHLPIIQMFHTLGELKNQVAQTPQERESDLRIQKEREVMVHADCLIAASPLEKSQMVWLYQANPNKIVVIPPGVDLNLFRPIPLEEARAWVGIRDGCQNILFVGRIEPLKGIDMLLHALKLIVEADPNWLQHLCVAIIGGDASMPIEQMESEMARLHRLRAEMGLNDLVTFVGKQDQTTLPYYYSAAEMLVMPSYYESFGMVALEAMACGTPVVASRVGGLTYNVLHGISGLLVPERNPAALADAITRLLTDPSLRNRLSRGALQVAECYGWGNITGKILQLYRRLLAPPKMEPVMTLTT